MRTPGRATVGRGRRPARMRPIGASAASSRHIRTMSFIRSCARGSSGVELIEQPVDECLHLPAVDVFDLRPARQHREIAQTRRRVELRQALGPLEADRRQHGGEFRVQAGGHARHLVVGLGGAARHFATAVLAVDQVAERDHGLGLIARTAPVQRRELRDVDRRSELPACEHRLALARLDCRDRGRDRRGGGGRRRRLRPERKDLAAQLRGLHRAHEQVDAVEQIDQLRHLGEPGGRRLAQHRQHRAQLVRNVGMLGQTCRHRRLQQPRIEPVRRRSEEVAGLARPDVGEEAHILLQHRRFAAH